MHPSPPDLERPPDLTDRRLRQRLRRAVVEHHRSTAVRPVLHVGEPGGSTLRLRLDGLGAEDPGLRTDLVTRMVATATETTADPLVWLTRAGRLVTEDLDLRWRFATLRASTELDLPLVLVVVTRDGWLEPGLGVRRRWVRIRVPPGV